MSKIVERMFDIIEMLQGHFGNSIMINKCYDPIVYIQSANPTKFPLILVSYKGSLYSSSKLYPCSSTFEIYFIDIKKKADGLLDLMQDVYNFFSQNFIQTKEEGKIVTGQKLSYQDQSFHAENNEFVIYVQRYSLLIPWLARSW